MRDGDTVRVRWTTRMFEHTSMSTDDVALAGDIVKVVEAPDEYRYIPVEHPVHGVRWIIRDNLETI